MKEKNPYLGDIAEIRKIIKAHDASLKTYIAPRNIGWNMLKICQEVKNYKKLKDSLLKTNLIYRMYKVYASTNIIIEIKR